MAVDIAVLEDGTVVEEGNMPLRVAWMSVLLVMLAIQAGEIRAAEYEISGERKASERKGVNTAMID